MAWLGVLMLSSLSRLSRSEALVIGVFVVAFLLAYLLTLPSNASLIASLRAVVVSGASALPLGLAMSPAHLAMWTLKLGAAILGCFVLIPESTRSFGRPDDESA